MATYYVDSSRPDDNGNGTTPETAKKTIAAGVALITAAADTLRFVGGSVWNETFRLPVYDGVTYEAYGAGDNPILRIATVIASGDWGGPDGNGCYTYTAAACFWLIEDDHALEKGSGVTLPEGAGTWYYSGGIIYYKPSSGVPGDHVTERVVGNQGYAILSPWPAADVASTVIDGLHLKYAIMYLDGATGTANLTPFTIKNCLFTETCAEAIYFTNATTASSAVTVQNNTFTACYGNLYLVATGSGIYNNIWVVDNSITKSNLLYDGSIPWNSGVGDFDGFSIQTIKDGIIERNSISGRCVDSRGRSGAISCWVPQGLTVTGNIIRKNFLYNLGGSGIIWTGGDIPTTDVQIYDNIISNFGTSGAGSEISPRGMELNKAQTSDTKSGVYNNTIRTGPSGIFLGAQADYFVLRNNIIAECTYAIELESVWSSGMVADHNLYHPADGNNFKVGGVEKTLVQYQAVVTPDDSDALTVDPLFANAGGSYALDTDFKLQASSPCINAGVDVSLTTDYGGFSIVGNPDIGAWEISGKIYTRGDYASLPTNANNLETFYTGTEVTAVAVVDGIRVDQSAPSQYALHEFKNDATGKSSCTVTWTGQSTLGNTTDYPTILEIYNTITGWEELDRDTDALADTNFTLSFPILSGLDNYKDANGLIACRVYQSSISR